MRKDTLFSDTTEHLKSFAFNAEVASVFPDMITRSVPGYMHTLKMIEVVAQCHAQQHTRLYDLGCSLGAASMALHRGATGKGCRIIGVDCSLPMIQHCRQQLRTAGLWQAIDLICADIADIQVRNASIAVMNFTLQFIPPEKRYSLLQNIAEGLCPGGILVLSEKITFTDHDENRRQTMLHEAFKRRQGYSDLEISQKRQALENVLIPETLELHQQRLKAAGFQHVDVWFQCFNFASLIAYRN